MPLKYGDITVTVLKYGTTNVTTGNYGSTTVFTATKKMSDQITGLSKYIGGTGNKQLNLSWRCVSGFTASYSAKISGTLYSIAGVSSTINQTYTQTGSTSNITKTFTTSDGKAVRNFVGTILFTCTGYDSYTYTADISVDLSNYLTVTDVFRDPFNTVVIEFQSSIDISYTSTTWLDILDTGGQHTYFDDYSNTHQGTAYLYLEFQTESGDDARAVMGEIYFNSTGFNEYRYEVYVWF